MIKRSITDIILKRLFKGKAIVITGARQVGKTTLVKAIAGQLNQSYVFFNCDEPDIKANLDRPTSTQLRQLIGRKKVVIIDEAQRIPDIGITAKLIVDNFPDVQLFLTGSSSFDIANILNEPLTGRKFEFHLFPLSVKELSVNASVIEENRLLENRMIFGTYPDIINSPGEEEDRLLELISSYMYKDILSLGTVKKPWFLDKLTQALALQVGSEISLNELSDTVGLDKNTISKYIDLLENTYIIFSLNSFSRNMRNELRKSRKIYFNDLGIRNAIIKNFNPLDLRADKGALWENFMIVERMKFLNNSAKKVNSFFWRTVQGQEIDYIEEYGGKINTFEFKWNPNARVKIPSSFLSSYNNSEFNFINNKNYSDFIS